jgi:hypothetical protein
MPVAIDVGQRVLVYNPSHGWTLAYFVTAQQTNDNKLQILVNTKKKNDFYFFLKIFFNRHVVYQIVIIKQLHKIIIVIHLNVLL